MSDKPTYRLAYRSNREQPNQSTIGVERVDPDGTVTVVYSMMATAITLEESVAERAHLTITLYPDLVEFVVPLDDEGVRFTEALARADALETKYRDLLRELGRHPEGS